MEIRHQSPTTQGEQIMSMSTSARVAAGFALFAASGLTLSSACAQALTLKADRVISGLSQPLYLTSPVGDVNRVYIVQQGSSAAPANARIRAFGVQPTGTYTDLGVFFQATGVAVGGAGSERGLLGLAFHPNFLTDTNGYFWINYTRSGDGATVIARGRRNGPASSNVALTTLETVLIIGQPASNHNGGWIGFGPDGFLYVNMGDGGGGNDNVPIDASATPTGNARDLFGNLLGKILRLDVDGPDNIPGNADDDGFPADSNRLYTIPPNNPFAGPGDTRDDEIYTFGMRNPWRSSFDRATGEMWIADVGQDVREEINVIPSGDQPIRDFGWRCLEGTRVTGLGGCSPLPTGTVTPIMEYGHTSLIAPTTILGCSITGGYVYRGPGIPCLQGTYFFADFCSNDIWSFRRTTGSSFVELTNRTAQLDPVGTIAINSITSFGEDALGELYIVDQGGEVFKIGANGFSGPDCNSNGQPDACDIRLGVATDTNSNGIPDSCEGPICDSLDFNRDTLFPDSGDLDDFIAVLGGGPGACSTFPTPGCSDLDFNNDGLFPDSTDLDAFVSRLGGGPCL
jgi:glucose/arabinose dehydrogenase